MKKTIFLLGLLLIAPALAEKKRECDCTQYPFKPNPPCYGICVNKLSQRGTPMPTVKNADAGVLVGISVLAANKGYTDVDFGDIKDKKTLEQAALESIIDANKAKGDVPTLPKADRGND